MARWGEFGAELRRLARVDVSGETCAMPAHKRNIACLESLSDEHRQNRLNVVPLLDVIAGIWGAKYIHLTCNTAGELSYNLDLLCKRNYGILYLAFHGSPGAVYLHGNTAVTLAELAEMMGEKFGDWVVHFGSCRTLGSSRQMADFVEQTGVALATGYTKNVDWAESAALDLLLFQKLQSHQSLKVAWRNVENNYGDLVEITGLRAYFGE